MKPPESNPETDQFLFDLIAEQTLRARIVKTRIFINYEITNLMSFIVRNLCGI